MPLCVAGITGSIGGLVGGWFATTVGSLIILGFAGWRFPLYAVGMPSRTRSPEPVELLSLPI
jgi:hypothetical protein